METVRRYGILAGAVLSVAAGNVAVAGGGGSALGPQGDPRLQCCGSLTMLRHRLVAASRIRTRGARNTAYQDFYHGLLKFGTFTARFHPEGQFTIESQDWPPFRGRWKTEGGRIELVLDEGPRGCDGPGQYRFRIEGNRLSFDVLSDDCRPRRMILDGSTWRPVDETEAVPERRIVRTVAERLSSLPDPGEASGGWPSFRGAQASGVAEGQNLPDRWDGTTGENIVWRTAIPGLAHSSPIVWGDRIFLTSAVSSDPAATFRPGLYGDGDASDDRSPHRWVIYALDKRTGKILWERVAHQGQPIDKRHIKSSYLNFVQNSPTFGKKQRQFNLWSPLVKFFKISRLGINDETETEAS